MLARKSAVKKCVFLLIGLTCIISPHDFTTAQVAIPPPQVTPTPQTELTEPQPSPVNPIAVAAEDLIHFGDLIDVDVVGSAEYDWRGTVTPEGYLSGIRFIEEPIRALCRTEDAIAADVASGLSKILKSPEVSVKILDRSKRPITIIYGAVRTPQRFQIKRSVRLNELLILAGGITEKASGDIQITRPPNLSCAVESVSTANRSPEKAIDQAERDAEKVPDSASLPVAETKYISVKIADLIKGELASNPSILVGDIVTVTESEPIYVIGGVANPRQINARSLLTVSRAIDSAGGFAKTGDRKRIRIYRRENAETTIIDVNYEKIATSANNDVTLKAFDIVEVAQVGRERKKNPPVVGVIESKTEKPANLPLRVID